MEHCDYVLHVASPFPAKQPKDENELIIPARDGAIRVLQAAKKAGVKRVVLTSSFAAIGYSKNSKGHVFTEEDWTDENADIQPYVKSKTIAEKAAWDYIQGGTGDMELVVINPVGIFGPILGNISSASIDSVVVGLIEGKIRKNAAFTFGIVDVRDVADLHIKAMLHPEAKNQRFLATSDTVVSFYEIARLIKNEFPQLAVNMADIKPIPKESYIKISNQKSKEVLDWKPRKYKDAILASIGRQSLK